MRSVGRIDNPHYAQKISEQLREHGIENMCEVIPNHDWGTDGYGTPMCNIWVIEEDRLEQAQEIFDAFMKDPLHAASQQPVTPKTKLINTELPNRGLPRKQKISFGFVTLALFALCCLLFIWSESTSPKIPTTVTETNLPLLPLFAAPIQDQLIYDYPKTFEILSRIVNLYGIDKVLSPSELPPEGQYLLQKYQETPYWTGFYESLVNYLRGHSDPWQSATPMFEKIQQGEWWRLITPSFLHIDIIHIFFNMFWLIILGNQIEYRIGPARYLFFILLTGIISNTAQYLMIGPAFMGFSGILCAMFTFIWMRKRYAPWEAYDLDRMTISFIMVFILGMALLQLVIFYLEVSTGTNTGISIGNTGHLTGALIGLLLGRWDLFGWKMIHK